MEISNLFKKCCQGNYIKTYYSDPENEKYFMISYNELLSVIGKDAIHTEFPMMRKNLLRIHTEINNAAHDTLYKYKFYPLIARCLYCLATKKTPSLIIHGSYVYFTDLIFKKFTIFQLSLVPIIHSGQFLDQSVTKTRSFQERGEYIRNYFEVLRSREERFQPQNLGFLATAYTSYLSYRINHEYNIEKLMKRGVIVTNEDQIMENLWKEYLANTPGLAFVGKRAMNLAKGIEDPSLREIGPELNNYVERVKLALQTIPYFKFSRFEEPKIM